MAFNGYVQVPPDSTGKKIGHVVLVDLDYSGGTIAFEVGDIVTGVTSGANGSIVKIVGSTSSGAIYLAMDYESATAFTIGENLQVLSITHALAASVGLPFYTPTVSIVDHENPLRGANVTGQGALVISPAEGEFGFDAFGQLKVSQERFVGLYNYEYGINSELLSIETSSLSLGETVTTSSIVSGLALWNGISLNCAAASGSVARVQSHLYHPYDAGVSQKWLGSITVGDTGASGVVRRWGYFDDEDGLFFELSGSVVSVVIRSSVAGGGPVETKIPQTAWNVDRADGTSGELNISGADLDVSKGFVYFIDYQWLGVGRVRYGIVWNGGRVVVHQETHASTLLYPYMRTGNLPARVEQVNYALAGGPVTIRSYSMAVISAANHDPAVAKRQGQSTDLTVNVNWTGSFRPLFSVRSKNYFHGRENRAIAIPLDLQVYSQNAPIVIQILQWPTLTGDTWTVPTYLNNSLEGDYTATTASGGNPVFTSIVKTGDVYTKAFPQDWENAYKIHRLDHAADVDCAWTVTGKLLDNRTAFSSSVSVVMNWKEIY